LGRSFRESENDLRGLEDAGIRGQRAADVKKKLGLREP